MNVLVKARLAASTSFAHSPASQPLRQIALADTAASTAGNPRTSRTSAPSVPRRWARKARSLLVQSTGPLVSSVSLFWEPTLSSALAFSHSFSICAVEASATSASAKDSSKISDAERNLTG
jgi:hypothetical protein